MAALEGRCSQLPASFEPLQLPLDDEGYVVSFRHGEATVGGFAGGRDARAGRC